MSKENDNYGPCHAKAFFDNKINGISKKVMLLKHGI